MSAAPHMFSASSNIPLLVSLRFHLRKEKFCTPFKRVIIRVPSTFFNCVTLKLRKSGSVCNFNFGAFHKLKKHEFVHLLTYLLHAAETFLRS
jgi:hypothetical protein